MMNATATAYAARMARFTRYAEFDALREEARAYGHFADYLTAVVNDSADRRAAAALKRVEAIKARGVVAVDIAGIDARNAARGAKNDKLAAALKNLSKPGLR